MSNKRKWVEDTLNPALKSGKSRQASYKSSSGSELEVLYTPEDLGGFDYERDLGYPGQYPYTRGIHPAMYCGRLWTMRQYSGFGSARDTNQRFHHLFKQGQSGLSIAFDLPTQLGYDSDSLYARGEVGRVGVAVDSLRDMEVLFEGIELDQISTSMTVNATCAPLLAMYICLAQRGGIDLDKLDGTVQNDILKEYIARNTYIFPPEPSLRLVADIAEYCSKNLPRWNFISISGYHIREAGSTAAQEIGLTMANAIEYVNTLVNRGLDVDSFAPRLSWHFQIHNDFFEEVAKLRALRRMWARIMKERFGAKDPRSLMFRTHVQTGGVTLTAQQPLNNISRATIQALAAVLGGVQSMAVASYDEAICIPTEEASTQSLRIQQIIASESGIADVVDPMGGSYYLECLTGRLENEANNIIEQIEKMGGAAGAIKAGYQTALIQEAAYNYQKEVEEGRRIVVGVNKYLSQTPEISLHRVGAAVELVQKKSLAQLKNKRDNEEVTHCLDRLQKSAEGKDNIMPALINCAAAYVTLGEMCDVLRKVFGTQKESNLF
ncbi:MAG: methylmalonyl-CoA mutase family protein [Dehalococcoidia bacterium]|jgi:methylmalonyl-CoA mutase N-terminal domain/subunit